MKRNLLLLIVLCCTMTMLAQNGKISYQAVVRDSENHLVYDTPLQVTVSLANSETGTAVYSEQHAVTSNANGLISLLIGDGQNKQGHWEDVQWNTAWVTATIRKASDHTFLAEHHLPLSAVPYALYADFADSVNLAVLQDYLDEHHYVTEDELPAVQANADWTETNPDTASYIKNKPDLSVYATNAHLNDTLAHYATTDALKDSLTHYIGKEKLNDTLAHYLMQEEQILSISHDTIYLTGGSFVKLPEGFSGDYNDLTNKPENIAFTDAPNTFTGKNTFTDTNYVQVRGFSFEEPGKTTADNCGVMVNACDLLTVYDSLKSHIDSLTHALDATQRELDNLVNEAPPAFNSLVLNEATTHSFKATAQFYSAGSDISSYRFCYSKQEDMSDAVCVDTNASAITFTGLDMYTLYYVTVSATNLAGTTTSATRSVRTLSLAPSATVEVKPKKPQGFQVGVTAIDLKGEPSGTVHICYQKKDGNTCPETGYTTCLDTTIHVNGTIVPNVYKTFDDLEDLNADYCVLVTISNATGDTVCGPYTVTPSNVTLVVNGPSRVTYNCGTPSTDLLYTPVIKDGNHVEKLSDYTFVWIGGESTDNNDSTYHPVLGSTTNVTCVAHHKTFHYTLQADTTTTVTVNDAAPVIALCVDGLTVTDKGSANITAVKWGESENENFTEANSVSHQYAIPGVYTITAKRDGECVISRQVTVGKITPAACTLSADHPVQTDVTGTDGKEILEGGKLSRVMDVEGHSYAVVQIGSQCWMAENLRTTKYGDGTVVTNGNATAMSTAAYYVPRNDQNQALNDSVFGLLYNWFAATRVETADQGSATGKQGICPTGWHLPTTAEWKMMETTVNGGTPLNHAVGNFTGDIAGKLARGCDWKDTTALNAPGNYAYVERNATGLGIVPAGRFNKDNHFSNYGCIAELWASDGMLSTNPFSWMLSYARPGTNLDNSGHNELNFRQYALSVRCLRNAAYSAVELKVDTSKNHLSVCEGITDQVTYTASLTKYGTEVTDQVSYQWSVEPQTGADLSSTTGKTVTVTYSAVADFKVSCQVTFGGNEYVQEVTTVVASKPSADLPSFTAMVDGWDVVLKEAANLQTVMWEQNGESQAIPGVNVTLSKRYMTDGEHVITATSAAGCSVSRTVTTAKPMVPAAKACTVDSPNNNEIASNGKITAVKGYNENGDEYQYPVVEINGVCWTAENMRANKYADGTAVPYGGTTTSQTEPYRYYPSGEEWNVGVFGMLYNWAAATRGVATGTAQGICPAGWHIPTVADWQSIVAVDTAGKLAKGYTWTLPSTENYHTAYLGAPGDYDYDKRNETWFSAVPAGVYYWRNGYHQYDIYSISHIAAFWCDRYDKAKTVSWATQGRVSDLYANDKSNALSVRCVRGSATAYPQPSLSVDPDNSEIKFCKDGSGQQTYQASVVLENVNVTDDYTYQWRVNGTTIDGQTGASFTYTYMVTGSYTISCMATPNAGASTFATPVETTVTTTVSNLPVPTFDYHVDHLTVTLNNATYVSKVQWLENGDYWDYTENMSYTYSQDDQYNITVLTTDNCSLTQDIIVNQGAIITVSGGGSASFCHGGQVVRTYTAAVTGATSTTYQWSVAPTQGTTVAVSSNGLEYTVTFTNAGNYTIKCMVDNEENSATTDITEITAVPAFTACAEGKTVTLRNLSNVKTIQWKDGETQTLSDEATFAAHRYTTETGYSITATSAEGCSTTATATNVLSEPITDSCWVSASGKASEEYDANTGKLVRVKDEDGNRYAVVQYGSQCWMAENLRTTNGSSLAPNDGYQNEQAYRYYPGGDASNVDVFGYLYNYYATAGGTLTPGDKPRGICPDGWHLPSNEEWDAMMQVVGTNSNFAKSCLWSSDNTGNGTDAASRFGTVPAGKYLGVGSIHYVDLGQGASMWSATKSGDNYAYLRQVGQGGTLTATTTNTYNAASVRCVRDEITSAPHPELSVSMDPASGKVSFCPESTSTVTYTAAVIQTLQGTPLTDQYDYVWSVTTTTGTEYATGNVNPFTVTYANAGTYTVSCTATPTTGTQEPLTTTVTTTASLHPVPAFTICTEGWTAEVRRIADAVSLDWGVPGNENSLVQNPQAGQSFTYPEVENQTYTITATGTGGCTAEWTVSPAPVKATSCGTDILLNHPAQTNVAGGMETVEGGKLVQVQDVEGHRYTVVQIGSQCWMAQNLRSTRYADGTAIANGNKTAVTTPAYYEPEDGNSQKIDTAEFGLLYNWYAATRVTSADQGNAAGKQGVCPTGWHLPTMTEWRTMEATVNGGEFLDHSVGNFTGDIAGKLARGCDWRDTNVVSAPGNYAYEDRNATGFGLLPSGRFNKNGTLSNYANLAELWISNGTYSSNSYSWSISSSSPGTNLDPTGINETNYKRYGLSVRCMRDIIPQPELSVAADDGELKICDGGSGTRTYTASVKSGQTDITDDYAYSWSVTPTDGATLSATTGTAVTVTYQKSGSYTVSCTATRTVDQYAIDKTVTTTVGYLPVPTFDYHVDHRTVTLTNVANVVQVQWMSNGEYEPYTANMPPHTYEADGQYDITVLTADNCSLTHHNIDVKQGAVITVSGGGSVSFCTLGQVMRTYTATVTGATNPTYSWSVNGSTIVGQNGATYTHTYTEAGTYVISCTVDNETGSATTSVTENTAVPSFTLQVDGKQLILQNIVHVDTVLWKTGEAKQVIVDGATFATHLYANSETSYSITATSTEGCSTSATGELVTPAENTAYCWVTTGGQNNEVYNSSNTKQLQKVKDANENEYSVAQIGNYCWMTENLRTTVGSELANNHQYNNTTAFRYYPGSNPANVETMGYLYNFYATTGGTLTLGDEPQGICPNGWHLPDNAEWDDMVQASAAGNEAGKLAAGYLWTSSTVNAAAGNYDYTARNESKFAAVPAGKYVGIGSEHYFAVGQSAYYWSITKNGDNSAYLRQIAYDNANVTTATENTYNALSVRCVRNGATPPPHPELTVTANPNTLSICPGTTGTAVTYTAAVTQTIENTILTDNYTYSWSVTGNPTDGFTSPTTSTTGAEYTVTFTKQGSYTVSCTATPKNTDYSAPSPVSVTMTVNYYPVPDFTADTASRTVTISQASNVARIQWHGVEEDYTENMSYTYSTNGTYPITAISEDGCTVTKSIEVKRNAKLTLTGSEQVSICEGVQAPEVKYTASIVGLPQAQYTWSVTGNPTDGFTSPTTSTTGAEYTVTFTNQGSYTVSCSVDGETDLSQTFTTTVGQSTDAPTCTSCVDGRTVVLKELSNVKTVSWTSGGVSQEVPENATFITHTYAADGDSIITATSEGGCVVTKPVTLTAPAQATTCWVSTKENVAVETYDGPKLVSIKDADNNTYPVVQYGSQCWMAENLRTTSQVSLAGDDQYQSEVAYRYYPGGVATYAESLGYLYNYYAAVRSITPGIMPQGICPAGWHIPDNEEWNTMIETASAANSAGKLAMGCLWQTSDVVGAAGNPEGRNASQFNVVPAGRYMGAGNPHYLNLGEGAFFWSATKNGSDAAYMRQIAYNDATVSAPTTNTYNAASVRCLRDELTQPPHPELSLTASPDKDSITFCQDGDTAVTYTAVVAKTLTGEILTSEYTYQWRVNGDVIANQTANTYKHTYSVTGTYTVTCIATPNVGGDPLEKTLTVKVGVSNPRFTLNTENAATGEVTLTEMADVNAVRWQENTDFVPVSGSSVEHQYTLSGSYTITAKDTTLDNCETTGPEVQVTVPKLTIEKLHGYDTICDDVDGSTDKPVAAILYKASVEGTTATSYTWSVSPSTNVTVTPFAHSDSCLVVYPTAGTYQVTCEVTGTSLSDTISVTVTQATGTETFGVCVEDKTVTFKAFVENTNKTSTTYHLYWGDGQVSEIPEKSAISSIFHTYSEAGTYSLIAVKDLSIGNKCSTKKQIVVLDGVPRTACPASSWLSNETQNADSITAVTDVDNNSYRVVYLGGKCWMAENLRVSKYADDASINTVTNGATYYPNDNVDNVPEYGLLYNWYAATRGQSGSGVQGICPDGWHVPTSEELPNDYDSEAGKLAGGCDWNVYVNTGNLNGKFPGNYSYSDRNVTGFGAVPAGYYYANGNSSLYKHFGQYAKLWLSDDQNLTIQSNFIEIGYQNNFYDNRDFKPDGFSVRCVRDSREYTLSIGTNVESPSVVDGDTSVTFTANLIDDNRIVERGFTYAWAVLDSVEGTHFEMPNTSTAECTITFKAGHPGIYRVSCTASIDGGSNNLMVKDTISVTVTNVFKVNKKNQCVISGTDQTATTNTSIRTNETGDTKGGVTYITKVRDNDATPNEYNVVQIGTQCWMKENLRAKYYMNGTIRTNLTLKLLTDEVYNPSFRVYCLPKDANGVVENNTYGLLYNWYTVTKNGTGTDIQGICPNGWHVPTVAEWETLIKTANNIPLNSSLGYNSLGSVSGVSPVLASDSTNLWKSSNSGLGHSSTSKNASGFSATPAGGMECYRDNNGNVTSHSTKKIGERAYFWTADADANSNYRRFIMYNTGDNIKKETSTDKELWASVRCVRNQ